MKRLILTIITFSLLISPATFALSEEILDFMDKNGIYYYSPNGLYDNCLPGPGTYDGIPTAGLADEQAAFIDANYEAAAALGQEYGIPWEAVVAQGILESQSGTSEFARERYNYFGLGATDTHPEDAYYYDSHADGWKGYFEFIKNNPRYEQAHAFDYPGDPYGYIAALKAASYATDQNYIEKISALIKAIELRSKEKGWASSAELAAAKGSDTSGALLLSTACSAAAQGNGDLTATALSLAWPDRSHALTDPSPAYQAALKAVGLSTYGEQWVQIGASCDAFVATVLRYSGVDPDIVCCGAANMLNYFANHPEKYEEIPNTGSSADLRSGDIRVKSSHVEMYIIDENGNGRIASASHADRTADYARSFYPDPAYRIFRVRSGYAQLL